MHYLYYLFFFLSVLHCRGCTGISDLKQMLLLCKSNRSSFAAGMNRDILQSTMQSCSLLFFHKVVSFFVVVSSSCLCVMENMYPFISVQITNYSSFLSRGVCVCSVVNGNLLLCGRYQCLQRIKLWPFFTLPANFSSSKTQRQIIQVTKHHMPISEFQAHFLGAFWWIPLLSRD